MKKKIKFYFKFIIVSVIIFSMILPSFATLSSADGSAFVTKAEFDALAGEINARLSVFEAGINSKIDSQVTSYLDRNGIWSGKTINLEAANTNVLYGVKANTSSLERKYLNFYSVNMEVANRNKLRKVVVAGNSGNFLLATDLGKTGLAFIVTKSGTAKHDDMRAVVGTVRSGETINTANAKWIYSVSLTIYAGDWDTKVGVARNKVTANFVAGGSSLNIVCPEMITGTVLFFTRKDEDLWYKLEETIDANEVVPAGANDPCTLYLWGDDIDCQSTRTYVFDSASIY